MSIHLVQKNLKKSQKYNPTIGGYDYGEDNNLAELISNIVISSPTSWQCYNLYRSFLMGSGFENNIALSSPVFEYTTNHLLKEVCSEMAQYSAVYIHVSYNLNYDISSLKVLPFNSFRIGKKDYAEYSNKIVYRKEGFERKGKVVKLDTFNPDKSVIASQVEKSGGFHKWRGQILFYNLDAPKPIYPVPLIFPVLNHAETERELSEYYLSTTRKGFKDVSLITLNDKKINKNEVIEALQNLEGSASASSSAVLMGGDSTNQKDPLSVQKLQDSSSPDKYDHLEKTCQNQIRKAFRNIPPQMIDQVEGKLGNTSKDDLKGAESIYNARTSLDREEIANLFNSIFKHYKDPTELGEIKQRKIYDDGTVES